MNEDIHITLRDHTLTDGSKVWNVLVMADGKVATDTPARSFTNAIDMVAALADAYRLSGLTQVTKIGVAAPV